MYFLHRAFSVVVGSEYTLRGRESVLGRHPVSNVSYVAFVETNSKLIGHGNNRADYTSIPGVMVVEPDFPEGKRISIALSFQFWIANRNKG
jgi:hypothetical protein